MASEVKIRYLIRPGLAIKTDRLFLENINPEILSRHVVNSPELS